MKDVVWTAHTNGKTTSSANAESPGNKKLPSRYAAKAVHQWNRLEKKKISTARLSPLGGRRFTEVSPDVCIVHSPSGVQAAS